MEILCFVGPPGSGKSTVIMKLSARFHALRKNNPAHSEPVILGFNTWNIAGSLPVAKMAELTGIRYRRITSPVDINKYRTDDTIVLVDMPGFLHNEEVYHELLGEIRTSVKDITFILVIDVNYRPEKVLSYINEYSTILTVSALCYTRCSSTESIPELYGVLAPPVRYISTDDRIPGELIVL